MTEIILDNGRLNSLRADTGLVAKFPFLGMNSVRGGGCCNKQVNSIPDYMGIRRAIVALDPAKREEFKQAIGAEKIRLHIHTGSAVEIVII